MNRRLTITENFETILKTLRFHGVVGLRVLPDNLNLENMGESEKNPLLSPETTTPVAVTAQVDFVLVVAVAMEIVLSCDSRLLPPMLSTISFKLKLSCRYRN